MRPQTAQRELVCFSDSAFSSPESHPLLAVPNQMVQDLRADGGEALPSVGQVDAKLLQPPLNIARFLGETVDHHSALLIVALREVVDQALESDLVL